MTARAIILLSLIGTGSLIGQPAAQTAAPPPSQRPGSIDGVAVNALTGEPLKKAKVVANCTNGQFTNETTTDASGHFHFDKVIPGEYWISAERDGFTSQARPGRSAAAIIRKVAEEQQVTDVSVKLTPLAVIGGHVLDEDGEPIALASVQALVYIYNQGRRELQPMSSASTNDLGEFQMLNVQPGRYYISATAVQRVRLNLPPHTRTSRPEETYAVAYYPSATAIGQASSLDVPAGARLNNVDFHLMKVRAYHVRGKVVDAATGQPVHNTGVQIDVPGDRTRVASSGAMAQGDGTFDVRGLVSGAYSAWAQRVDGETMTFAQQPVNVQDEDVNGVALALAPGLAISGTVSFEGAQPDKLKGSIGINLQAARTGSSAQVDDSGTFTLTNVLPGVYFLNVFGSAPGHYVKSIRFGDREVPGGSIDLTQGVGGKLTIVYGADGGEIDGAVQNSNGDPAPNVIVTAAPADGEGRPDLFRQTMSDANGNFKMQELAPGDYKVFAWEDVDQNLPQSFEFRKVFEGYAASVSLAPSAKETAQLKLIPAATIEEGRSRLP